MKKRINSSLFPRQHQSDYDNAGKIHPKSRGNRSRRRRAHEAVDTVLDPMSPKMRAIRRAEQHLAKTGDSRQRTDASTAWTPDVAAMPRDEVDAQREELHEALFNDPIVKTTMPPAFGLIMLLTLLMFWRGHQLPGGGFVGGALTVCALVLYRIAESDEILSKYDFPRLVAVGLAIAFTTGFVPYLLQKGFLNSDFGYLTLPVIGEFEWASAMLFDLGVFLVVVGGSMTIINALVEIDPKHVMEGDR